jgi:hypothetical protein
MLTNYILIVVIIGAVIAINVSAARNASKKK